MTEGGRLVWLTAEVAAKHLSSRAFLAAARRETAAATAAAAAAEVEDEDEAAQEARAAEAEAAAAEAAAATTLRLQEVYAALAECALTLLQAATTAVEPTSPSPKAKTKNAATKKPTAAAVPGPMDAKGAARMERGGRQVLTALDGLLAPGTYLRAVAPLLSHGDGRVRRKALRLIAHRLAAAAAAAAAGPRKSKASKRKGQKSRDARSAARAKDRKWYGLAVIARQVIERVLKSRVVS